MMEASPKPFRFGVNVRGARSRSEWMEKASRVEELGYDVFNVPDHLTDLMAPFPALMSAAAASARLRIGTHVLNNDLRHPVLVAREAATVDLLTEGRLELGLGAGSLRVEYEETGLSFDRGALRVERLAEAVAIIKRLLGGEAVTFAGKYYRITNHTIGPLPVQRPHPPILIGGNGRKLLSLAAREADIVGLSGITFRNGGAAPPDLSGWRVSSVDERIKLIREAAGEERYAQLEINVLLQRVIVTSDRHRIAEELAAARWPQLTAEEVLQAPYVLIGDLEQISAGLLARRQRWGISGYTVQEPYMEALAPVIAEFAQKNIVDVT
jgi:probable F420-dependent oxidoreductase